LSLASEKGGCNLDANAKGIESSPAETRVAEIRERWMEVLPDAPDALWDWLLKQEQAVVLEFLAFCVGQTVHAVRLAHDSRTAPRLVAADKLAKALALDMADWWTATGESYLGRVKKDQVLEAITEGTGETNLEELRKLKKPELVATAEKRLAGTRWLPQILRA
jgi:ParB family transcriptional regulator, chromosome partitioning protein